MLCLKTEVMINLGLLQVKRDGAGAAVVFGENRTIPTADNRRRLVFPREKKKGGEDIEFRNPRRNGAVF